MWHRHQPLYVIPAISFYADQRGTASALVRVWRERSGKAPPHQPPPVSVAPAGAATADDGEEEGESHLNAHKHPSLADDVYASSVRPLTDVFASSNVYIVHMHAFMHMTHTAPWSARSPTSSHPPTYI